MTSYRQCFFIFLAALLSVDGQTRYTGEIDGASYIIDVPGEPSGDVLFIARGFRPDFFPVSAVYEVDTAFYQTLLSEGWTIASTGFRTNDWIIEAGAADIIALREYIEANIRPIQRAILYGETMGGGIAVWLAENESAAFDGVFALGADLFARQEVQMSDSAELTAGIAPVFSGRPQVPIIFVANLEEAASSRAYLEMASGATLPPALWSIDRPGHVNVNSAERLSAIRALIDAISGAATLQSRSDAMLPRAPASTAEFSQSSAQGRIEGIRPLYGNIYTSFVEPDLAELGIAIGSEFRFYKDGKAYPITFAKAYSDVPYGAWVAFIDSEGFVQISRNYANAAETIAAGKGDSLRISPN